MELSFQSNQPRLQRTIEDIVRIFYPRVKISEHHLPQQLTVITEVEATIKVSSAFRLDAGLTYQHTIEEQINHDEHPLHQLQRVARLAVYAVLLKIPGNTPSPWGILTGIRPTKIVHRWRDQHYPEEIIECNLVQRYALTQKKARLMIEVAKIQRPFFPPRDHMHKIIGIYIGIPFCPSRCKYCSFPSVATDSALLVKSYISTLFREIAKISAVIKAADIKVDNIYVGGGTPTVLDNSDFGELMEAVRSQILQSGTKEFTVEAGRPDTINEVKLTEMKRAGVNRISINPQTMHQDTLEHIGRKHTVELIKEKFYQARTIGFDINMDIILGLPGETLSHVEQTLEEIGILRPDNLTVHALALKRTAEMTREKEKYISTGHAEAEKMVNLSHKFAVKVGMRPYYLYRQKNTMGHLENIGYSLPGKEGRYNINIMEERQTILGLGAGAGSKFVEPNDLTLTASYHPKDIRCYIEGMEESTDKKIDKLTSLR